jgi:hypothetical protein
MISRDHASRVSYQLLNINTQSSISSCIIILSTGLIALRLAFVSRVSLSALGVFDHLHVLQLRFSSSLLGFWHECVVTVRDFYMECNAGLRWCDYFTQLLLAIFTLTNN